LKPAWANSSERLYLKKPFTEIGLVEWLKVKALSSSPSTTKQTNKQKNCPQQSNSIYLDFTCLFGVGVVS
jgi:hypothetical protein